jgi:uncharacterized phage protein (TIGR01671 family)
MREIKFRAWDEIEGYLGNVDTISFIGGGTHVYFPGVGEGWAHVNKEFEGKLEKTITLEQYTGLHDKNGKEIYEGDIVRSSYRGFIVIIEIGEAKYLGVGVTLAGVIAKHLVGLTKKEPFMIHSGENDWQVVGNIHENPEFMK